jgi:hypothetical protein
MAKYKKVILGDQKCLVKIGVSAHGSLFFRPTTICEHCECDLLSCGNTIYTRQFEANKRFRLFCNKCAKEVDCGNITFDHVEKATYFWEEIA